MFKHVETLRGAEEGKKEIVLTNTKVNSNNNFGIRTVLEKIIRELDIKCSNAK